jgi:TfoX/Sxy family transcriptional regulator of competence genes
MPYNQELASRIRLELGAYPQLVEKKMFGGIGFLLNGNMACGVHDQALIVRIGPERSAEALTRPYTRLFDMTGRPMSGWIVVDPPGCQSQADLQGWLNQGIEFARTLPPK